MPLPASPPLPPLPRALAMLAGLAILAVAVTYGFYIVFSRSLSQDEGYLMITVQSFLEGNALYDSVFTQYGPSYYFYEWIVRGLLAVPLTHDATRLLSLFHWVIAAALLGFAARRITGSALAGLFVFAQAFVHLTAIASEPGHPQELVVVLIAFAALVATAVSREPMRLAILAAITALLAFTKINVGIFFGLALLLAVRCQAKDRFSNPLWTWLLSAATALLPALLMRRHLGLEWCRNYCLLAACTVSGALIVAQCVTPRRAFTFSTYGRMVACFLIPAGLLLGLVAWTGTSLRGLIDGLFVTPLKMPRIAVLPLPLSNFASLNAVASLGLALTVALRWSRAAKDEAHPTGSGVRRPVAAFPPADLSASDGALRARDSAQGSGSSAFDGDKSPAQSGDKSPHSKTWRTSRHVGRLDTTVLVLKAAFGIAGTGLFIGKAPSQMAWLMPWVWLVLLPVGAGQAAFSGQIFARLFLVLTAAWQGLQAYPIAGTQTTTATFLLTLGYALCLYDVASAVFQGDRAGLLRQQIAQLAPARLRLAQGFGVVVLIYLFTNVWCRLSEVRREYAGLPALNLPGSRFVHLDAETTAMYRELSAYLEKECDTFVTYPGINSLYFWTGKRPPTHLNSTGWGQLSHAQQTQILTGLQRSPRPLLVVVAAAAQSWNAGAPEPILPLVRCVTEDCREVKRLGRFILFIPKRHEETAQRDPP